ncbi:MAG: SGNH/GDSL hydrolase family protein [Ruminococcaceae bacterium]|nr:SGNH/GDSL hydrolase family protein [Oscillospiraceae bacterium]
MDYINYYKFNDKAEKPLERIVEDGGFCKIFRTIGCVGDSLSSGEFESLDEQGNIGYHDLYEYSWGQFLARDCGCKVFNFSRGGMTAKEYMQSFAQDNGFWDDDKVCQAYIIALGVNDILNMKQEIGSVSDIDLKDYNNNKDTFAGWYSRIIQRLKEKQPKARFFLVTMPQNENGPVSKEHTELLYELSKLFEYTYVIDLDKYAPVYDEQFRKIFYLSGHLNAAGYVFTAKIMESYIDYIIRHNMDDFCQIGFVGTEYHNVKYKW